MLFSAMVDVALDRGIERYTGVIPDPFRRELLSLGWQAEPLGPAVRIAGGPIGAFLIHVRPDTPERLGWNGVYSPVLDRVSARSEEHTSELQSLMRISYAVFCLKKNKTNTDIHNPTHTYKLNYVIT